MQKSENISNLAAALAKTQAIMANARKDSSNPFFKSSYADLTSCWDACRQPLTSNGLSISQLIQSGQQGINIETILLHESGEWLSSNFDMPILKNDPQSLGSSITYGRRYALASCIGLSPEDDDAESAMNRSSTQNMPFKGTTTNKPTNAIAAIVTKPSVAIISDLDATYHERIRSCLTMLFDNKDEALTHIEKLSSFLGKDNKIVVGVRDYTKLTGKRLEFLCNRLESEIKKPLNRTLKAREPETPTEDPFSDTANPVIVNRGTLRDVVNRAEHEKIYQ